MKYTTKVLGNVIGNTVLWYRELDSTNLLAAKLLSEDCREGTVVMADSQTKGKGQQNNSWESEPNKNITFTVIFKPTFLKAEDQFLLSKVVSLGVTDFLAMHGLDAKIKWPNDIYINDKKITGILIEHNIMGSSISDSIAGIGININQTEFRSNAPNPVSLKQITNKEYDIESILKEVLRNIYSYYMQIVNGDITLIINSYKDSLFRKDGYHLYNDGNSDFLARIKDIEPSGILVLETKDSVIRRFAFKEVKYILG